MHFNSCRTFPPEPTIENEERFFTWSLRKKKAKGQKRKNLPDLPRQAVVDDRSSDGASRTYVLSSFSPDPAPLLSIPPSFPTSSTARSNSTRRIRARDSIRQARARRPPRDRAWNNGRGTRATASSWSCFAHARETTRATSCDNSRPFLDFYFLFLLLLLFLESRREGRRASPPPHPCRSKNGQRCNGRFRGGRERSGPTTNRIPSPPPLPPHSPPRPTISNG